MKTISVIPDSKEHWLRLRHQNINSTEVSCLFDCNKYSSAFQLWHEKRQPDPTSLEESLRMKMGTKFQSAIAEVIAEQESWIVEPMPEYIYSEEYKIGSSFDYRLVNQRSILEIKNVDSLIFRNDWDEENMPPHIELQVQQQMLLSGYLKAVVGVCVGGNQINLYHRDYNSEIGQAILLKVNEFFLLEEPPAVDYAKDFNYINSLYQTVNPGQIIESTQDMDDIAAAYQSVSEQIKELEVRKDQYKAQMLTLIGESEKVKSPFYTISCGMTAETQLNYTRKAFRNFRITPKKIKETK